MPADLVIFGTVLTVDDASPTAEALAVADGRIVAVGDRADVDELDRPRHRDRRARRRVRHAGSRRGARASADGGDRAVRPDRRHPARHHPQPPTTWSAAIRSEVAVRGADGAYLNGWDPLLQVGLPEPTLAWLDEIAPDTPLVIIHNSGHKAYFNAAAAASGGLTRDTPDPKGCQVRPRRERRPRRHRRGDGRGVPAAGRGHRSDPTIRRCCSPSAHG